MELNLSKEHLDSKIEEVVYEVLATNTTICLIQTKVGVNFEGVSHCADMAKYDSEVGKQVAYDKALGKLIEAEVYLQKSVDQ